MNNGSTGVVDAVRHGSPITTDSHVRHPVWFHIPAPAGDGSWQVYGELYVPTTGTPATVQVAVHGLTYDRRYWTLPGDYHYADFMVRAGHAVLVFDRIGNGRSDRPPASEVTVDANVVVLHHIIRALRQGRVTGRTFERVVTVGHSFGSGIAIVEAARHRDVDALVVSGMLHSTSPLYEEVRGFFHPAAEDPILGPADPPPGYMTQRPGLRVRMLENPRLMDPEMSRLNESIKSTGTIGEGDTLPQTYEREYAEKIDVPVLIVVAERDALFSADGAPNADAAEVERLERRFFSSAPLETHVIPEAGHSLNIHRNAAEWYRIVQDWAARNGL